VNRRNFLQSAGAVCASVAFPTTKRLFAQGTAGNWRSFEVTTRIEILRPSGVTRAWLPAALVRQTPFQKTLSNTFHAEGGVAKIVESKADCIEIVAAEFPVGTKPVLTMTSRIATRDYAVDLSTPGKHPKADRAGLEHFRRPTKLLPTDGIVKETANQITTGGGTDPESSITLSGIRKRAAAASATSASC